MSSSSSAPFGRESKNGVSTIPGSISVTLMSVSASSWRSASPDRADGPLGGRVERAGEQAPAGHRAREEEMARAALAEVGEGRADRVGGAEDVGVDHRAPLLGRFLEEAALRAKAGVREDDVDAAEPVERRRDQRLLVLPYGDVAALRNRAPGTPDRAREAPQLDHGSG